MALHGGMHRLKDGKNGFTVVLVVFGQHPSADSLGPLFLKLSYLEESPQKVRLVRLFELLRLLRGCGRRSCGCRCLVVGKVAIVPIVLSVAVVVDGGESVRNMSVLRNWRARCSCGRCEYRCRPR